MRVNADRGWVYQTLDDKRAGFFSETSGGDLTRVKVPLLA